MPQKPVIMSNRICFFENEIWKKKNEEIWDSSQNF